MLMLGAVDRAAVDARRLVLCHQPAAQYSLVSQALLPQGALCTCAGKLPQRGTALGRLPYPRVESARGKVGAHGRMPTPWTWLRRTSGQLEFCNQPSLHSSERSEWDCSVVCRSLCAGAAREATLCSRVTLLGTSKRLSNATATRNIISTAALLVLA